MKIIRLIKYRWPVSLLVAVLTPIMIGYGVLPIAHALRVAHPARIAVCCQTPANFSLPYEAITILTQHGLRLQGWLIPSRNGATVVMAHGFGSNRLSTLDAGAMLAREGFGVLLMDLAAHGESEGRVLTLNGDDILAAVNYLLKPGSSESEHVGVWGFSLGGLVAIQAASQTSAIGGVVADGPFPVVEQSDMPPPETLEDRLWMPFDWVQWKALGALGVTAHNSVKQALAQIAPRPVFLIAGTQNRGERRVLRAYAAAGSPQTTLWEIPEAGHLEAWQTRRDDYVKKVVDFFNRALLPDTRAPEK